MTSHTTLGCIKHGGIRRDLDSDTKLNMIGETTEADNKISELDKHHFAIDSFGVTAACRVSADIQRASSNEKYYASVGHRPMGNRPSMEGA